MFTYDPEKAKELLKEAGVDSIDITLLTTDHPWITALAPQVKNDLDAVGIHTTIQSEASSSLYANNTDVEDPQFDAVLAPGDPSVFGNDPDLLMNWWYGDNSWTQKRTQWNGSEGYTALHELLDAAVARLREEERTRTLPVVVLTSSREEPDVRKAYALGVNSYVVKPVEFEKFVDAVGKVGQYWLLLNLPQA